MAKALFISKGKNDDSSQEDGSFASKEEPQMSYEGGPETMPEPKKPAGGGKPSREQLLANLKRLQAKLNPGPTSINPDELLRGPQIQRPGMPGGPALPALNPAGAPSIDPSQYHGSDAAGPGMGAPPRQNPEQLSQQADQMFKQMQAQRDQITPKAPTDDALYREMLRIYGGG